MARNKVDSLKTLVTMMMLMLMAMDGACQTHLTLPLQYLRSHLRKCAATIHSLGSGLSSSSLS